MVGRLNLALRLYGAKPRACVYGLRHARVSGMSRFSPSE
jgi:hypothetical protein